MHDLIHDLATSLFSASTSSSYIREINAKSYTHKMSIGFAEVVSSYSPSLLNRCVSLRVLNLSRSKLGQLPSSIGDLVHLRYLDLSRNIFRSLPENLCKLQNLQTLNLRYCVLLSCLPKQTSKHSNFYFGNLKGLLKKEGEEQFLVLEASLNALEHLGIECCVALERLPEEGLKGLTSLRELSLQKCKILKCLPEGLQHLTALTNERSIFIILLHNVKSIHSTCCCLVKVVFFVVVKDVPTEGCYKKYSSPTGMEQAPDSRISSKACIKLFIHWIQADPNGQDCRKV
uniref:Blight resistance protein T118 n=1 Tax=Solanum tuberosum TaxID=4113 RepID=M1BFP2_SOLTU